MTSQLSATVDTESNPYAPLPPTTGNSLLDLFLTENQYNLRQQHNKIQAGDSTFDWSDMTQTSTNPFYNLGSLGRFVHPTYGMIYARYVQFVDIDQTQSPGGPYGWVTNGGQFIWQATNTVDNSNLSSIIGLGASFTIPTENSYGWIIVQGINIQSVTFTGMSAPAVGDMINWDSDGLVSISGNGTSFATIYDVASQVGLTSTTWEIEPAGLLINSSGGISSQSVATFPTWDFRYWANVAGIVLGTGNDQPAADAVHAACRARENVRTIMYVKIPPGEYDLNQLLIFNAAGYWCDPGTALLRQKPWTAPTQNVGYGAGWGAQVANAFVMFGDLDSDNGTASSACSWIFAGFKLDGGWKSNWYPGPINESDPALFHYEASAYSGGDPSRFAYYGQTAVLLRGAFNPPKNIGANSPFSQNAADYNDARYIVGNLDICGFGGDGFNLQGTGAGFVDKIETYSIGGRGIVLNMYDCKIGMFDSGGCGLEAFVFHSQFADTNYFVGKGWFTNLRANAGKPANGGLIQDANHNYGCWMDTIAFVHANIQMQDTTGWSFRIDGIKQCQLDLHADYAGLPPAYMPIDCGGIQFNIGRIGGLNSSQGDIINFTCNPAPVLGVGPYPHYKYVLYANAQLMGSILFLTQINMPTANQGNATTDYVDPAWIGSGNLTIGFYPPSLPAPGTTLILNGTTITFGTLASVNDIATAINGGGVAGVTASTVYGTQLLITSTLGSPAAVTISGTAAPTLGLTTSVSQTVTTTSQSYFDRTTTIFGSQIRTPKGWLANSSGVVNMMNGYAGITLTAAGLASLQATNRQQPVSLAIYDQITSTYNYPVYAELDVNGKQQIGFLGKTPIPIQSLGPGPVSTSGTLVQAITSLNIVMNLLQAFGLGNFGI